MRKKVLLVFTLTLLNLSLFAQSQRIYVLFNQFGRICTGVAEAGTFVLECPNLPVCSFDYNIRDNVMNVYNPNRQGFIPASYYFNSDHSLLVVASDNNRYEGVWYIEEIDRSSPSFEGKHCSGTEGCSCSGFKSITSDDLWKKSYCKTCGHHKNSHK